MIRLDDHTVLQADGIPELRPGDSLEAEPDENGRLILGGTRYIAGVSEDASYRVIAVVPESAIFSKTIVSPITLALVFTAVFLLTGLYAWFLRTDYLRGRVEEENPGSRREHIGELLLRHVRLVFYLVAGCAVLLILLDCTLHVVDSTRVWGSAAAGLLYPLQRHEAGRDGAGERNHRVMVKAEQSDYDHHRCRHCGFCGGSAACPASARQPAAAPDGRLRQAGCRRVRCGTGL
jgi:hypothetical protein